MAFKFPIGYLTALIRPVHIDEAVRIGPFDLGDHSCQRNRLVCVVFRSKRVMCRDRNCRQRENAGYSARQEYVSSHNLNLVRQFTRMWAGPSPERGSPHSALDSASFDQALSPNA